MTLAETLPQKLSDWRPAGEGRHSLSQPLEDARWTLHLSADRVDSVGCVFWEVMLVRSGQGDMPELAAWAESVAERAGGLLEPLTVIEVDGLRREALLRSETPSKRGGGAAYYEVILHDRDRATLRRFRAADGKSKREQVGFALTHESLAHFVEGITQG